MEQLTYLRDFLILTHQRKITDKLSELAHIGPHQYATTWGSQTIREALARKQKHFSGMDVDPNQEIVVTCGGTEAMMAAMLTVCNPGDKVVVFSPFYENYGADAILSGAEPIYVPLVPPAFPSIRMCWRMRSDNRV